MPKPKINFLKISFSYRATKGWNELSDELTKNIQNLSSLGAWDCPIKIAAEGTVVGQAWPVIF